MQKMTASQIGSDSGETAVVEAMSPKPRSWRNSFRRSRGLGLYSGISLLVGCVFATMVVFSLGRFLVRVFLPEGRFDLSVFAEVFTYEGLPTVLMNTAVLVATSMAFALVIGSFFAWLMERTDARLNWLAGIMPILPMLMLPIAGAIGWVFLLSERSGFLNAILRDIFSVLGVHMETGPLNIHSWAGLIALYTAYQIPYAFLMVSAGLRNSDPSMEEAMRISGASLFRTIWTVTIPALRPNLGAAALYMVWFGFSLFSIPVVIGTELDVSVLSVEIVRLLTFTYPANTDLAVGLSAFLLVAIGTAWYFQRRILGANRHAAIGGKGQRASTVRLGALRWPARLLLFIYVALTFVLPVIAHLLVALNGYWTTNINWDSIDISRLWLALTQEGRGASRAFQTSLTLALLGATTAILAAAVIAMHLRGTQSRVARAIDGVIKLPAAFSAIVIGVSFVIAFAGPPFNLSNTFLILFLCYLMLFMPQASIAADAAAAQVDRQLGEASRVAGAGGGRTFFTINLPLMLPGLVAGWGLVFVWMTGELNASVMLAGTRTPVVGYSILQIFQGGGYAILASLALTLTVVNTTVLALANLAERRMSANRLSLHRSPTSAIKTDKVKDTPPIMESTS